MPIEPAVHRIVVTVQNQLSSRISELIPPRPSDVDPVVLGYLDSPDFAEVARQVVLWRAIRGDLDSGLAAELREQITQGLRHAGADEDPKSVLHALTSAEPLHAGDLGTPTAVSVAHLASAAVNNTRVLRRAPSLPDFHLYAEQLRSRIAAMHAEMRLPHIGVSRSVPYDELYVRPTLSPATLSFERLSLPGHRTVLLGDPGAGKSTLAAKLAHDIAVTDDRVPFLLVLRDFTSSFREGGRELRRYFEHICNDPYNLTPPRDAVEYLLRNGRAVVILDGLDELVEPELRRRVVRLVEGFAHQYPLTPMVVTARKVGYLEAPLSESLFARGTVEDFDTGQVADYATHWFALDASTPEHKRGQLAKSFVDASRDIEELRRNPLLLALLCAMYATDHYIPRNLAQAYERCAVMLFDRWDSMRGIALPVQFHGRLRFAVQYLAWHMFTFAAPESGGALTRSRIVRILADYLESKSFDADGAVGVAEQFTEFCTGRAWILTDIGATRTEPQFGFTHRTFMEYFAAEHLVRKHTDSESLWRVLSNDGSATWNVVSKIALQLHDRYVDDGADEVLRLAVNDRNLPFSVAALSHLTPQPITVHQIVATCLEGIAKVPDESRITYHGLRPSTADIALQMCLHNALPENLAIVHKTLRDQLLDLHAAEPAEAIRLIRGLLILSPISSELRSDLLSLLSLPIRDEHRTNTPWIADFDNLVDLAKIVAKRGARALFESHNLLATTIPPPAVSLLSASGGTSAARASATAFAAHIADDHRRPWLSTRRWLLDYNPLTTAITIRHHLGIDLELILCLPYLEMNADHRMELPFAAEPLHGALLQGREAKDKHRHVELLEETAMHPSIRNLLHAWMDHYFNAFEMDL